MNKEKGTQKPNAWVKDEWSFVYHLRALCSLLHCLSPLSTSPFPLIALCFTRYHVSNYLTHTRFYPPPSILSPWHLSHREVPLPSESVWLVLSAPGSEEMDVGGRREGKRFQDWKARSTVPSVWVSPMETTGSSGHRLWLDLAHGLAWNSCSEVSVGRNDYLC